MIVVHDILRTIKLNRRRKILPKSLNSITTFKLYVMKISNEFVLILIAIFIIISLGTYYVSKTEDTTSDSNLNYILVHQVFPEKDVAIGTLRYPPSGVSAQIHTLVGENQEDHEFIASLKPGDHIMQVEGKWTKVP